MARPASFTIQAHFSGEPATPTARQPLSFAICPTTAPTAPDAAETTTVSPALGRPMSRRPTYAVIPGMPSTPRAVVRGASFGSSFRRPTVLATAWDCQPLKPRTKSPFGNAGLLEAITSLTVPPTITVPRAGFGTPRYDLPSFMRPRM